MQILVARQLAESCSLCEALYWIALRRAPLESVTENNIPEREDPEYMDDGYPDSRTDTVVSAEECKRAGLEVDPRWEEREAGEYYGDPDQIRDLMKRLSQVISPEETAKFDNELIAGIAFRERCEKWDAEFELFLDIHAAKLFIALREGRIPARGRRNYEDGSFDWPLEWETIVPDFWIQDRIDWLDSMASGRKLSYCQILVDADALFDVFPLPEELPAVTVSQLGDAFVLADQGDTPLNALSRVSRGRRPFPWHEFHVEVAKRFMSSDIPMKQEAFVVSMQEWCASQWKKDIGRSTLVEKIKPYYDVLVRKSGIRAG